MSGIYIHVPFCKKICYYCDFHFSLNLSNKHNYIKALCNEIALRASYLDNSPINTLYFGGGTPSVLNIEEISSIFEVLSRHFDLSSLVECTIEVNPDDLSSSYIDGLKSTPINRLSIGIQSFFDDDLLIMNRRHSASEAFNSVLLAQAAGFRNISIDLMYGLPNLSLDRWKQNITLALQLGVPHLSAYHLSVEKKTAFYHFIKKSKYLLPTDEMSTLQYQLLVNELSKAGFLHYEISNFSLPGHLAVHNTNYWKHVPYLGLGPSAHSFNGSSRQWNISNNMKYILSLNNNELLFEAEHLSLKDSFNEYLLTSLRTMWGVDIEYCKRTFPSEFVQPFLEKMSHYSKCGYARVDEGSISLTDQGMFLSDALMADVFVE